MIALSIKPQKSKLFLITILVLHGLLAVVIGAVVHLPLQIYAWVACVLSAGWAYTQWRHSAAYLLDIHPDGVVWLSLGSQSPVKVTLDEGGLLSRWVTVACWRDEQGKRYRTVLWRDGVDKHTFKQWLVWLRWQPK